MSFAIIYFSDDVNVKLYSATHVNERLFAVDRSVLMFEQCSFCYLGLEKQINQEEDESSNDNEQASAALRIRKTQHATTVHMLVEALAELNAEQIDYKEKCEERMQKVVSIGIYTKSFVFYISYNHLFYF